MARSWGPVEKPVEHDVKGIAADAEGSVTTPSPTSHTRGPITGNENYNATDGRHSKSDHGGWPSIDGNSGCDVGEDGQAHSKFEDGPGKWRQT
jgi:hypothetical protein